MQKIRALFDDYDSFRRARRELVNSCRFSVWFLDLLVEVFSYFGYGMFSLLLFVICKVIVFV